MKITLKLYANLSDYLPPGATDNAVEIDVPSDASLGWIIDEYRVPRQLTHLVLVNGVYAPPGERDRTTVNEGDTLAIWPPIAGG